MAKDIFDKLALKNKENLSATNFQSNTVLGTSHTLDSLKINDDFSNSEMVIDQTAPNINNSYVSLGDNLSLDKKYDIADKKDNNVNLASYTLKNKI